VADSKRTTIIKNVVTTLAGITTDNGYHMTVSGVEVGVQNLDENENLPRLFVVSGEEEANWQTNLSYNRELYFLIIGKVHVDSDDEASGILTYELEDLLADIFKIMHVDIQRGNAAFVDYTRSLGCQPIYDWGENIGYVLTKWMVEYHHESSAP